MDSKIEISIIVTPHGGVTITGPLGNPKLSRQILCAAIMALDEYQGQTGIGTSILAAPPVNLNDILRKS